MSDQNEFTRSGPHPTYAGNLFDPRVHGEDGSGAGNTTGLTQDTRGLTGDSAVTGGSTSGLTRGSSSGLTGGSGSGLTGGSSSGLTGGSSSGLTGETSSGLTGSEGSGLSSTTSNEKQGVVPTVLSYIGLGGSGTNSNAGQVSDYDRSRTEGDLTGAGIGSGGRDATGSGAGLGPGSGLGRDPTLGSGSGLERDSTLGSGSGLERGSAAGLGAAGGLGAGTMGREPSYSGTESNEPRFTERTSSMAAADTTTDSEPSMQDQRNAMRNVTDAPGANNESGLESRGSTVGTGMDDSARSGSTTNTSSSEPSEEKRESTTGHAAGDKVASKRENPSSIPIAGGTRVGEAHMGESKIVPDNPKPAGQDDQATADNTAKNAGAGGDAGEHKEGLMGKLKDKMPGHKH